MVKFTFDQQRAIEDEGNIIVSAGAGSGKTAVLSERVLYYVKEKKYSIKDFLILTFTRLAAGEMKNRIRKKLAKNNLDDANYVDIADITTFDSFSNGLVKKYHTYLNIDQNFSIIDSNIISVLKRKYIREELDNLYLEENPIFFELLERYCYKDDSNIEGLILDILNAGELEIDKEGFYEHFIDKYYSKEMVNKIISTLFESLKMKRSLITSSIDLVPDTYDKKGNSSKELWQKQFDLLDSLEDYDSLLEGLLSFSLPRISLKELDQDELDSYQILKDKIKKVKDYCKELCSSIDGENLILSSKKYFELLIQIAKKVDQRQFAFKTKYQVFEFSDIGKFAIKLVKENPNIREELKNKYKMIMIDEYQDTSEIQEIFISYIQNNNVYCVGDIKQSIYGFRNARCDIFKNKYQQYKSKINGKAIDLNTNFRSRKEVLDNINTIFKEIMTNNFGGADYLHEHMIEYGNKAYLDEINPSQNNNLEIYSYQNDDKEKEIRIIANDIISKINSHYEVMEPNDDKWTLRPCEFKDFAIIIDRGNSFEDYLRVFNEYQIPLYVEKDEDIKNNNLVSLLKNILIIIKYLKNNIEINNEFKHAFVSLARSFIFEYSDQKIYLICQNNQYLDDMICHKIKDIIVSCYDDSYFNLFYQIIESLDVYSLLSKIGDIDKNASYLDSFISSFKQMEELDFDLDDFIEYLDNINQYDLKFTLSSKGSSINSVRLLNIHKSKGLEFNIIYFPGLNKSFPSQDKRKSCSFSSKFGPYLDDDISLTKKAYLYDWDMENLSERIRLFYVSLTRAREKMIFLLENKTKYLPKEVFESNSFYDLFYPLKDLFVIKDMTNYQNNSLHLVESQNESISFNLKELNFDHSLNNRSSHASKELSFKTDQKLLDFGNKLHQALEDIDFINPDYSLISSTYIKNKVKGFLSSDLIKNVNQAKVFKEYEFIDEVNHTEGIIDLFLKYPDRIVLIDYKTKNIDDENYNHQIKVYYDFLYQKYHLPIDSYLYSIIDEKYRKVDFD